MRALFPFHQISSPRLPPPALAFCFSVTAAAPPPHHQITLGFTMAAPAPPVAADPARTADPSAYSGESTQEKKLLYTFETLAQHNTREELWMLLHDKVYDVTAFMDEVRCSFLLFGGVMGMGMSFFWCSCRVLDEGVR